MKADWNLTSLSFALNLFKECNPSVSMRLYKVILQVNWLQNVPFFVLKPVTPFSI